MTNQTIQPTTPPDIPEGKAPAAKAPSEKVEISYTDPQAQFIEEMRERLGLNPDEEEL
jgi:hypothetical protein